ncbi:LysR family transcriptional regulator [Variovorax sp. KK3]|uniref:LysR family transcriptional regulator n=1 Tax=Variovorax sp. KK3 TaxID=1855728 RepID=UPI00097BDC32|nr:LysR family transcriptional regulator [Variovorax sp. KK3]
MDLRQLRALLTIAETGSITRAAEILHIVQPALSRQVKLFEEEVGVALFDRERHGMVLTAAGRQFAARVKRALAEIDKGKEEISPKRQHVSGSVVVGFLPSAAEFLVSGLMGRVRHHYPSVQLRSSIAYIDTLRRGLEVGDVDVALLLMKDDDEADRIPQEPVLVESLFLVGPHDAALDITTPVPLSDLQGRPFILPSESQGLRAIVERECGTAGVTLTVSAEAGSMSLQKSLVSQGAGLAILSGLVIADEVARGILTACPIDAPNLNRRLCLARSPAKQTTEAAAKVLDELRATVREHVLEGRWPGAVLL